MKRRRPKVRITTEHACNLASEPARLRPVVVRNFPKPHKRAPKPRKPLPRRRVKPRRTNRVIDTAYLAWIRTLPCSAPHPVRFPGFCGATPVDPHHTKSRGAGGSDRECLPFCRACHRDVEALAGVFKRWDRKQLRDWYAEGVRVLNAVYAGGSR